jgi:putative NIF3 family GTP cyclohydrolase 1 type 2
MTAREVVDLMKKTTNGNWSPQSTRDTFKVGSPDTEVKGIATTMMATFDMIQRAYAAGLNMVLTHEDTYWNDRDDTKDLTENALYKRKTEFIEKNGMVIFRDHDHMHSMKPDFTVLGTLKKIGINAGDEATMRPPIYTIPETTFGEFAARVKRMTGSRALRCAGDPNAKVSRILIGPGYATPRMTPEADVVIGGEQQEADGAFDNIEYVMDAASLGKAKCVIMLGHVISEQPGMEDMAAWLRTLLPPGIPVKFVPAEEPFW